MLSPNALKLLKAWDQSALDELLESKCIEPSGKITDFGIAELNANDNMEDMTTIAKSLKYYWPSGNRNGSPWKEADALVRKRLEQFIRKYGKYTGEQIIDAGKRYATMEQWNSDKTYMLSLRNFIFCDGVSPAGAIEEKSMLLTFIEDPKAQEKNIDNWQTEMR